MSDRERPLNRRGQRDVPLMARRLISKGGRPSLILTSPAVRARQTSRLLAQTIGYPVEFIQTEQELYLADPEIILDVVAGQDNTFTEIVVVGHNPGITELANRLGRAQIDNVPTCGMVRLESDIRSWDEFGHTPCDLIDFDYPKQSSA
jgi:phosphohistidine phosphatase